MKLNVRLLRRIKDHILEEPRRFFMGWYVARGEDGKWSGMGSDCRDLSPEVPPCGTAACIAGWANILTKGKDAADGIRAAKKLGIDLGCRLFIALGWPAPFNTRYSKAKTPRQRARVAADRIEHLIATGE